MNCRLPEWRNSLADYPANSHFLEVDGCAMHFLDEGPRDGKPVLMVHGNPTWSWYWRHLVAGLSDSYRAIAVDHVGCGLSDKPVDLPYTLDVRIRHLNQLVQSLDLHDITLVAHDWGGSIGLGAALEDLDRYRQFVLLNTAAFPPPFFPLRIRVCRTPVLGKIALQGLNLFARAALTMATGRPGGLPADLAAALLAPYDTWNNRRAIYEFVADIPTRPEQPTMQRLKEIEQGLSRISDRQMPVLLLWGMRDWCFRPECLRIFQQHWPHAITKEFSDCGHYVMEDAREEIVGEVRQFLGGEGPDAGGTSRDEE